MGPGRTSGQEPPPPPEEDDKPTAPFVAKAPEYSRWVIRVTSKKPPAAPSPTPGGSSRGRSGNAAADKEPPAKILAQSEVTKTANVLRDILTWTDGTKTENWFIEGMLLRQDPVDGHINLINPKVDRRAPQFGEGDFEDLAWLNTQFYARNEVKNGRKCFVYQWRERMPSGKAMEKVKDPGKIIALMEIFLQKPLVPTTVWIDRENRFPVAVEDENASRVYAFLPPPTEVLRPAGEFAKTWQGYQDRITATLRNIPPRQQ